MKKLFLMIATVAALFATSCVTDTASDVQVAGNECDVTLSVKAPGATSRTIADGLKAVKLTCGVYDADWKYLTTVFGDFDGTSTTTTISMRLVKGKEYNFVFWAQAEGAPYTLTLEGTDNPTIKVDYTNVTTNESNVTANDDNLDAFYGRWACTVNGTINETITLTRPFAQINFGTSDEVVAKEFGFNVVDADAKATVTVTTMAYTTLSLKDDGVTGEEPVTFNTAAPVTQTTQERLFVNNNTANYYWLAMNYILVPKAESPLAQCDLTVEIPGQVPVKVSVPMAPAKRNWRTNLVGSLLTEQGNFTIQIDPILEQSDEYLGVVEVGTEEEFNAAFADPAVDFIVLTGDVHLTQTVTRATALLTVSAGKSLTIDLNGNKLTAETPQMFEVLGTLVVKNGVVENPAGDVFAEDATNVTRYETTVKDAEETIYYDEKGDGHSVVSTWAEFTAALVANKAEIMLGDNITYTSNYQLQKAVVIDLNGKTMELPMINIHKNVTIKNGTINGKMYARTGCKATLEGLTFSGTISDDLSTEGHLQVQGSCDVYAKNCTFAATTVNGSQTRSLSIEGSSSGIRKFEGCDFKFVSWGTGAGKYKKNVYINTMNGTTTVDFTDCKLNGKAPNIIFAAAYPLTNLTMSGCDNTAPTLEINRAKDTVTEVEWAHISSLIANNKFTQVRVFYAGGSSEYIR